jgi:glyoxylase-like metal-dependent hydrolase (beta-lactamase superfamily II)
LLAGLGAPAGLTAQAGPGAPAGAQAGFQRVAPGIELLPGRFERGRQPDGNSLVIDAPAGAIVIDSGRHVAHTGALVERVRGRGRPLVAVVNTHWHLDHLGGNLLLRATWPHAAVHASSAVTRAVGSSMGRTADELRAMLADPALGEALRAAVRIDLALLEQRERLAPTHPIADDARTLSLGGRALQVGVERDAVSGGDVWLLEADSGVLAVGDLVTLPVPFFDTACPTRWRDALGRVAGLPFRQLVPGHGPVMTRDDFARWRGAFDKLLACAAGDAPVAACSTAWIADLGPLLRADEATSVQGMLAHYFQQHLRAEAGQRDRFCGSR